MINYNTGKWGLAFAFTLRGSVFPKAMCFAFPSSLLAYILHVIISQFEGLETTFHADNVSATVLSGFTFILGFLIVFRSQQAYSRWWEGGTLMQQIRGEWFNAFSSLLSFCSDCKEKEAEVEKFQQQLARLVSLLYGCAINQVAEVDPWERRFEFMNFDDFDIDQMDFMRNSHDPCEVILQWVQRLIVEADKQKIIQIAPPILSRVYNQLGNGIVLLNNAHKISAYPIPFALAQMITLMLMVHWTLSPILVAASVKTSGWACVLCFVVVFSFWSIHFIGEELEQPFGNDPNDLPIFDMQRDLNRSLCNLLDPRARYTPEYAYNPECKTTPTESLKTLILQDHIDCLLAARETERRSSGAHDTEVPLSAGSSGCRNAFAVAAAAAVPLSAGSNGFAEATVPTEAAASQHHISLTLAPDVFGNTNHISALSTDLPEEDLPVAAGQPPDVFGNTNHSSAVSTDLPEIHRFRNRSTSSLRPAVDNSGLRPAVDVASRGIPEASMLLSTPEPRPAGGGGRPQAALPAGGADSPVIWLCGAGNFMRRSKSGRELCGGGSE